jgi:hypothetical protein
LTGLLWPSLPVVAWRNLLGFPIFTTTGISVLPLFPHWTPALGRGYITTNITEEFALAAFTFFETHFLRV